MAIFIMMLQAPLYAAQRNLALHRKLDYSPKPTYKLTMHPRDSYLLTDGRIDGSLWYERYRDKTVGWGRTFKSLLEITIDLGQIYNVDKVKVYTVGGGKSCSEYPEYVIASSSLDGNKYVFSSFASSDGWDFGANLAKPKVINLPVEQRTRYIKLLVRPTGLFFFTDEIEVIESEGTPLISPSGNYLSNVQITEIVERTRQIQRDIGVLKKRYSQSKSQNFFLEMEKKIGNLSRNLTFDQLSIIESEFSVFRASLLNSTYKKDWVCYQADPMDILRFGYVPVTVPGDAEISLYQWKNEHGAAAINIVNSSPAPIVFEMSMSPLRLGNKELDSKNIFELRRAVYVRVINSGLVADPLVLQNSKPFPVAPGETVQIWIEAHSKGLEAGLYDAAIAITAQGDNVTKTLQTVPIKLEVANKTFPSEIPFSSCNWGNVTIGDRFTSKKISLTKSAVKDLGNHYINVISIRFDKIYHGKTSSISSLKLDREFALRKDINPFYLINLGGHGHLEERFGTLRNSKWESKFKEFLSQFRNYMLNNGIGYDRFAFYPFDEYVGDDFIYVAKIIRDFDPQLKIYANNWIKPDEFNNLKGLIDIWCPHVSHVLPDRARFDKYRSSGLFDEVWCYGTLKTERFFAPAKMVRSRQWRGENRVYWRTMPIVAASLRTTGAGFWTYAIEAGWIKDKVYDYGVVYKGSESPDGNCFPELIVPSKRWRQWRQGIEDAVCLNAHKELLDEFYKKPSFQLTSNYLTTLRKRADQKK